ncbi:hypothetical protein SB677_21810, partial [Bacillus sp. SIMBA_033]
CLLRTALISRTISAVKANADSVQESRANVFVSYFPKPKLFFTSAIVWALIGVLLWYFGGSGLGAAIGLPPLPAGEEA